MKKLLSVSLTALLLCGGVLGCTHVHTEECGENGVDCVHECYSVMPCGNEHSPI